MSGGGHFEQRHIADTHSPFFQSAVDDQPLVGKSIGNCDPFSAEILNFENVRFVMDHHCRAVAMAQVHDFDGYPLFAQRNRHGCEDEGGLQMTG